MKWLRTFLGLCVHHWEVMHEIKIKSGGQQVATLYVLKCNHCGNLKKKEF